MPQPSLDGSGMKDISDGLHTINTVQCLQLSGQLKPSPPHSDPSDTDLASGQPPGLHAGPMSPRHHYTGGLSPGLMLINASGSRIYPFGVYSSRLDKMSKEL